jgi:predicted nucleic acid-binding protein
MVGFEQVGISSISAYELYLSAYQSEKSAQNTESLTNLLNCFRTIEFITQDGSKSIEILKIFEQHKLSIGQLDLAIIAQAINRNMVLITQEWLDIPSEINLKTAVWA